MLQFMCFWIWLFGKNNFWALQIEVGDCQCDDEWMVTRKAFYILKLGIWNWSVWRTGDVLTPLNGQKYGLVCFLTILLSVGSSQPNMDQIYWAKCAKQGLRMCWIRRPCNVPNIVTRRLQKLAQKRFDSVSWNAATAVLLQRGLLLASRFICQLEANNIHRFVIFLSKNWGILLFGLGYNL